MAAAFPRQGLVWDTSRRECASLCRDQGTMEVAMPRRRKSSYQPTSEYNAYLAGWVFAFLVVLVTIMLTEHGVHF
jgi:hypothetical protein